MNRVCLIGRLTKDPELRTTQNGTSQTTFTIAVNRKTTNDDGERQADFISCKAWRTTADNIFKYFYKGDQIAVEGHIQTGSYDAMDGTKRYTTDVVIDNFTFVGTKETSKAGDKQQDIVKQETSDPFKDMGDEIGALDDGDMPF